MAENLYVFIDALCINQSDEMERAAQVRQMISIYEHASCVWAWVGVPRSAHEATLAGEMLELCKEMAKDAEVLNKIPSDMDVAPLLGTLNHLRWLAVLDMFREEYWSRTWIIQEVTAAAPTSFWYGDLRFSPGYLEIMRQVGPKVARSTVLQGQVNDLFAIMNRLCTFSSARRGEVKLMFLGLCHVARHTRCSDPRDKVYAMRYLATDLPAGVLEADYTKSVYELYMDIAKYYIVQEKALGDILALVRHSPQTLSQQLPSWVPNWQEAFDKPIGRLTGDLYRADDGISEPAPALDDQKLQVHGRILERLAFRSSPNLTGNPREFRAYAPTDPDAIYEHTKQTKSDAFKSTLIGDMNVLFLDGAPVTLRGQVLDWSVYDRQSKATAGPDCWIREQARMMCLNRAFGITELHDYCGLFPAEARVDDLIVVLVGCHTPYDSRHLAENEYTFLGECYVHGAMDGQAMINGQDLEMFVLVWVRGHNLLIVLQSAAPWLVTRRAWIDKGVSTFNKDRVTLLGVGQHNGFVLSQSCS